MRFLLVLWVLTPFVVACAEDPLVALPVLPKPVLVPAVDLGPLEVLGPGISIGRSRCVVLSGEINLDQGPVDGLEVLACLKDGKKHEALVRLDAAQGSVVKAACIAALGLADGEPTQETSGQPARGSLVQLTIRWAVDGQQQEVAASSLVRDREIDRPYPALPWIYTGSRFQQVYQNGPDGRPQKREVFMLDTTRSVAVNFDEPDALIASPFPGAGFDRRFEVYSALCPPVGTPVTLVISVPAPDAIPRLALAADGTLRTTTGTVLDDPGLTRYLAGLPPATRAVAVGLATTVEHRHDLTARSRILAAAAAAKVWIVPVFVLVP
jgi:hypothetical protein